MSVLAKIDSLVPKVILQRRTCRLFEGTVYPNEIMFEPRLCWRDVGEIGLENACTSLNTSFRRLIAQIHLF